MTFTLTLKWTLLLGLLVFFIWWHYRENALIRRDISRNHYPFGAKLLRIAEGRSLQFLVLLTLSVLSILAYDHRLIRLENKIIRLSAPSGSIAAQSASTTAPSESGNPLLNELYSGSDDPDALAPRLDRIKEKYEETLVTYFFMNRCRFATPQDYHIINSALLQELAAINAPAGIANEILVAARGSYTELYARSSCEGSDALHLTEQYASYLQHMLSGTPEK